MDLGFKRALADAESQVFFRHPHELPLIDIDRAAWLRSLEDELDTFVPSDLFLCNSVKPKGAVRPGGILPLRDQAVYAALVSALTERIRVALSWGNEHVDFSYPLSAKTTSTEWFGKGFPLWRGFAEESLKRIRDWANPVIFADIAAYYECIDIGLLLSDLRGIGAPAPVLDLLSKCLNKWSQASVPGRSLPQGFSASNILARFYLNRVDRALRERGINHLRYVDDIRVFCRSEAEAKRHFVELIVLLRKRGLAVQTAKSEIMDRAEAVSRIEGLIPALQTILKDYVDSIAQLFEVDDPYFVLAQAERKLAENPHDAPIGLIHEAYRRYFLQKSDGFDKTLFHFLIRRLGHAKDAFGLDHALSLLRRQPQETREILSYVGRIDAVREAELRILEYFESGDAAYPHQYYEFVGWRMVQATSPSERCLNLVRSLLFDKPIAPYLRSACREFLGRFGSDADIERLHDSLPSASADSERAELLCCLRRMEASRRNSVLARYASSGPLTDRAILLVRSGWMPSG